jgi:hypothetical protein
LVVPSQFESVIKAATSGVLCLGCKHSHYLVVPVAAASSTISLPNAADSVAPAHATDREGPQ